MAQPDREGALGASEDRVGLGLTAGPSRRAGRLAAVARRDPDAEGAFWCSVVTTGVYCRPTCPSRRARAENLRFHDTLEEARATGFRPCRRCRPEDPSLRERQQRLIEAACLQISTRRGAVTTQALADEAGLSLSYFHRLFRKLAGTTPAAFGRTSRGGRRRAPPPPGGGRT